MKSTTVQPTTIHREHIISITLNILEQSRTNTELSTTSVLQDELPLFRYPIPANNDDKPNSDSVIFDELITRWSLLQMYGSQALDSGDMLGDMPTKTLPERLAAMLLDLSAGEQRPIQGPSYQLLADRLGTRRETVGAILRSFRRQGFVELGYRHIEILDEESLADLGGVTEWQ